MALAVTVTTATVLQILRDNRQKHRTVYDAAMAGWRLQALVSLEERVASLRAGGTPDLYVSLPKPTDHTQDYNQAIRMLELHTDTTIRLDSETAAHYIEDNWQWRRTWGQSASSYAQKAYTLSYGVTVEDDQ
jgi:hypothetical protein